MNKQPQKLQLIVLVLTTLIAVFLTLYLFDLILYFGLDLPCFFLDLFSPAVQHTHKEL